MGLDVHKEGIYRQYAKWWLRSAGEYSTSITRVSSGGFVYPSADPVSATNGVRPAITVNLSDLSYFTSAGTVSSKDSPIREQQAVEEGIKYNLDKNGVLTITGTGILEYENDVYPWESKKSEIQSVVIGSGVRSIGANAFSNCENLVSVSMEDGVTMIGICSETAVA